MLFCIKNGIIKIETGKKGGFAVGLLDEEQKKPHAAEERLMRFGEFVKEQKAKKSPGMPMACLQSEGYRDFYGKLVYGVGMHRHMWLFSPSDNSKAVLYKERKEAAEYAKKLQKSLRDNGYPASRAWAEQVAVFKSEKHPYSGLIRPTVTIESEERYIIQMIVK